MTDQLHDPYAGHGPGRYEGISENYGVHPGGLREALAAAAPRVLEIGRSPAGNTDSGQYISGALRAAHDGMRFTVTCHGEPFAEIGPPSAAAGPDLLIAIANGDTLRDIQAAAMSEASALYGNAAPLVIERTGPVHASGTSRPGRRFWAEVRIRCARLPGEETP